MWTIKTTDVFDRWFAALNDADRACVLAALLVLREKGPGLPGPYADTLRGSRYSNMKELRIQSRATRYGLFSLLTRTAPALCFAPATKLAMKSVFTMRCSRLPNGNSRIGLWV